MSCTGPRFFVWKVHCHNCRLQCTSKRNKSKLFKTAYYSFDKLVDSLSFHWIDLETFKRLVYTKNVQVLRFVFNSFLVKRQFNLEYHIIQVELVSSSWMFSQNESLALVFFDLCVIAIWTRQQFHRMTKTLTGTLLIANLLPLLFRMVRYALSASYLPLKASCNAYPPGQIWDVNPERKIGCRTPEPLC